MATYNEFADKIKAKYPGSYDHVDNRMLAEKMIEKYPEYSDRITFDEPVTESPAEQLRQQALGGTLSPEAGDALVAEDEAMHEDPRIKLAKASAADPEAMERHGQKLVEEREARMGTEAETTADVLSRNIFGKESATPGQAIGTASTIFSRGLGAITQQGDLAEEDTRLLKPFIDDLQEWSSSREAQNTNADAIIKTLNENVRKSILSGEIPKEKIASTIELIDKLEESKNSGALTTATDVVGGLMLEIGSDPFVLKGLLKGIITAGKKVARKLGTETAETLTQKALDVTSDRLAKFGVRNKKMIDFIEKQPGESVREKLVNIRKRQAGELTPSGQIQDESIEAMFDERTLSSLEKNADNIQAELDRVKDVGADVRENIAIKKEARKDVAQAEKEASTVQAEIAGAERKGAIEAGAEAEAKAIPSEIDSEEVVKQFTKKGKFSGRGTNEAFNEAEKIAKTGKIDVPTRKGLIEEMIASAEGDVDRVVDYTDIVNKINAINKKAPLAEYKRMLRSQDIDPAFAESFRRIKQGNANDIVAAKRQFNKALSKEGSVDDTIKRAADNFKVEADDVVENALGAEGYEALLSSQELGGKAGNAKKKLFKAMKIDSRKSEVVDDIDFNDAIANLDEFIDDAATKFAKEGTHKDFSTGGRFPEWKKHFGIDVEKEVRSRAKKIGIASETKEAVKAVDIDTKKAQKAIVEASASTKQKIDRYAKLSTDQVKKGIKRRVTEIKQALSKAKTDAKLKGNVASDFSKEVRHFADEGGFSKNTDSFKAFKEKYGEKLADMVEDQAIFSTFNVSSSGKISNADNLLSAFKGVRTAGHGTQYLALAEGVINKAFSKVAPYEWRLNRAMNKIKSTNAQLSKELNRMKKKAIKKGKADPTKEAFSKLMERNPLVTADIMSSEFKFFDVLSLMDKAFIARAAASTGDEFTNKERMSAKRLLKKLEGKGK
ncbi:hypothetical protein QUF61_17515 [Candidatus Venteria ishoeyi]|uniref:hypothetical protein n=1 Tax=Candidatus Venteria ishoeyi TaxID=1899563 RepID=UPI0025A5610A|nr:hypothetical protein [Candidatus Venteria ishoeyi]MDM8548293.1 hypothetical protein [Candidatus Venteria ishoeyi]